MNEIKLNNKEYRQLDTIKIKMAWLDKFLKDFGIVAKTDFKKRLWHLKKLSESDKVSEEDKKDMMGILETLGKIANCNLCHKEIDWTKQGDGLYALNPTETARCKNCHEKELKNHDRK